MRWLIALLIAVLALSDLLGLDLSLAPGVSVKNAFVYVLAMALALRLVIEGELRLELAVVHACFAILIGYALLTWLLAALVIEYPNYGFMTSAISLKANLIDPAVFFFACFHGARTAKDVGVIVRTLAIAVIVANVFTLTDIFGWTDFGVRVGEGGAESGRVFGVFGHANDTAALLVTLLPAIVALALCSSGVPRLLWLGGALATAAVLLMTVSRGAYVGVVVGGALAVWLCRHAISTRRVAATAFVLVLATAVLVAAVSFQVGDLLADRIFGQSAAIDVGEASSGRTDIWSTAIGRMFDAPITLFTGYGWGVYKAMPFRFAPHNHYLGLWFDLGLVGLLAYLTIFTKCLRVARSALEKASGELRALLVAFIFGMCALAVAVFFTDLTTPWLYIWAYVGVSMRAALIVESARARAERRQRIVAVPRPAVFHKEPMS